MCGSFAIAIIYCDLIDSCYDVFHNCTLQQLHHFIKITEHLTRHTLRLTTLPVSCSLFIYNNFLLHLHESIRQWKCKQRNIGFVFSLMGLEIKNWDNTTMTALLIYEVKSCNLRCTLSTGWLIWLMTVPIPIFKILCHIILYVTVLTIKNWLFKGKWLHNSPSSLLRTL